MLLRADISHKVTPLERAVAERQQSLFALRFWNSRWQLGGFNGSRRNAATRFVGPLTKGSANQKSPPSPGALAHEAEAESTRLWGKLNLAPKRPNSFAPLTLAKAPNGARQAVGAPAKSGSGSRVP